MATNGLMAIPAMIRRRLILHKQRCLQYYMDQITHVGRKEVMRKVLVIVLLVLCGLGLFLILRPRAGDLKTTLEDTVEEVRHAISTADFDTFMKRAEGRPGHKMPTEEEFKRAASDKTFQDIMLDQVFPDLRKKANFLTLKTIPGWAAYYAETDLDDPNYTSVSVLLFRKSGAVWKACGAVFGLTKARPGSEMAKKGQAAWKGREDMLQIIEAKPEFQLDKIIGDMTKERPTSQSSRPSKPGG